MSTNIRLLGRSVLNNHVIGSTTNLRVVNPIPEDTRGIVDPVEMMRYVDFVRCPPGDTLGGLIEMFWSVEWQLPDDRVHDQQILNHPAGNISVGTLNDAGVTLDPAEGRVYGVITEVSHRRLTSTGWTVAARTSVGGLGVLLDAPAKTIVDTELSLDGALPGLDGKRLTSRVRAEHSAEQRIDCLRQQLSEVVALRDPVLIAEAREVTEVASVAEHDRTVRRVEQLAAVAGVSVRTLQRLFDYHVGVSPSFVIRRWRIIEAVEAARIAADVHGGWSGWATVAAELGYADQAHLTRDFRRHLGTSPAAYIAHTTRPNT